MEWSLKVDEEISLEKVTKILTINNTKAEVLCACSTRFGVVVRRLLFSPQFHWG
jgi:hypothetical protein